MSGSGQTPTFAELDRLSGLPSRADIMRTRRESALGPIGDIGIDEKSAFQRSLSVPLNGARWFQTGLRIKRQALWVVS
jgi:hypothetical protein